MGGEKNELFTAKKTNEKQACSPVFADHLPTNCSKQVFAKLPSRGSADPFLPLLRRGSPLPKQHQEEFRPQNRRHKDQQNSRCLLKLPGSPSIFASLKIGEHHISVPVLAFLSGMEEHSSLIKMASGEGKTNHEAENTGREITNINIGCPPVW